MTLTEEERNHFQALAQPLIRWLRDTCHPHVTVVMNNERAELLEGLACAHVPWERDELDRK